ncbi:MAG: hypothetical protein H2057_08040 [Alphaproteobacteria bacterium]|nr:hypothetical protein [Alphaproteobacteria bacterium]
MAQFPVVLDNPMPTKWQLVGRSIEEGYSVFSRPPAELLKALGYLFVFLLGLEIWRHYFPLPLFEDLYAGIGEPPLLIQSLVGILAFYPFLMVVVRLMAKGQAASNLFSYYGDKTLWRVFLTDLTIYGVLGIVLVALILPIFVALELSPSVTVHPAFWAVVGLIFLLVVGCLYFYMRVMLTDIHVAHGHAMEFKKISKAMKGKTFAFLILWIAVSLPGIGIEIVERALLSTPAIWSVLASHGFFEVFTKTVFHFLTYASYAVMWAGPIFFYRHVVAEGTLSEKTSKAA